MKGFKKMSVMLLVCLLLSVIAMPVSASAAKLNKKSISLNIGKTYTLKATGTKGKITWTSSKKSVATVSSKGVVKAKKKGTAVITAKYGKKKLICKVTVKQPVTSIKLNKKTASLTVGDSITLKATISPTTANNKAVTWKSSDTSIATVSSTGVVTGKDVGTVSITATAKDGSKKKATCKIQVEGETEDLEPEPDPEPTQPAQKDLLTELKEGFKAQLIVPSVGSSSNYYCQVKFTNNLGRDVKLVYYVHANGKMCENKSILSDGYTVKNGYYAVSPFYRGLFRPYKYDMYLDNYSTAWTRIEVDGKFIAMKFDVAGNTEFGYKPQDLGIY